MSSAEGRLGLAGWDLADMWGIEFEAAPRQLGRLWMAGAAVVGVSVPFSLGGRLLAAAGAAVFTHAFMWLGAYVLINRMASPNPQPVPVRASEVTQIAALASAFGEPLALSDWVFEKVGHFETASTVMDDSEVDSLVTISRIPGDSESEDQVTLGFVGALDDGWSLVSFLRARPLIPYENAVQLFDPAATAQQLWAAHRERMLVDGARSDRAALHAVDLRHVSWSLKGALRFLPEWTRSITSRAGELRVP